MILSYATSSLSVNNILPIEEMVTDNEWEILQNTKDEIEDRFNVLNTTEFKFANNEIKSLQNFESAIDDFVTLCSASYDNYLGRYIVDGDEKYKNELEKLNYFLKLKDIYKNWGLTGYSLDQNSTSSVPNNFNEYIYFVENNENFKLSNEIVLMYECNISGSDIWNNIADIKFDKNNIDFKEQNTNYVNSNTNRWIWNFKVNTNAVLNTSDYFIPRKYPYDWAVNRQALISWHDSNRIVNVITTSSIFIPGVRGSLLEIGSSSKRVGQKNGKWYYTFASSSYNLFQDYTGSFSPNILYNSKSKIIKQDLFNTNIYLNFGYDEYVPIPIVGNNLISIPHEDNIYSTTIVTYQSSSINNREFQVISSNPNLFISTNIDNNIPYAINIIADGENIYRSGDTQENFKIELVHNGLSINSDSLLFETSSYTNNINKKYKNVQIDLFCRDWILQTEDNIKTSPSNIT